VAQRGQRRGVRLAILPFENLTGDPQRGCMISGITEEIGTRLTRDSGERLRLLPSWSVKGLTQAAHPVSAARQEGVDFLLGGSVRSAGERARVNAQLVRVYDDIQLWAESYERPMGDVLDFQSEVAHLIADGARGKLSV
jgi:adenylate cyclase